MVIGGEVLKIAKLVRTNLAYTLGSAANSAALFILIPFLIRALTTEEYGAWSLLEVVILLFHWLLLAGLDVGLMREYWFVEGEDERRQLVGTALSAVMIWGAILLTVSGALLFTVNFSWNFPGAPQTLYLALAIGLTEALFALLLTLFRIQEKATTFAILSVGRMLTFLACSITLMEWGSQLVGLLVGRLIAALLFCVAAAIWARHHIRLRPQWASLRRMLVYGLPLLPTNLTAYVLFASDRYFLQHFTSLEIVGIYSFAYKIATTLDILITRPFSMDWAARRFKVATQPNAPTYFAQTLLFYLFTATLFALVVSVVTPTIYAWVASPLYLRGMGAVTVVLLAYLIYGLSFPLNIGIMLKDQTRYLPLIGGLSAAVCLALNWWLIPNYGMLGAAWASVIAYTVWTAAITWMSLRLYPIPYPLPSVLSIVLAALLGYAGIWQIDQSWPSGNDWLALFVKLAWILLLFGLVAYGLWGKKIGEQLAREHRTAVISSDKSP